jgi:hypothetical protein
MIYSLPHTPHTDVQRCLAAESRWAKIIPEIYVLNTRLRPISPMNFTHERETITLSKSAGGIDLPLIITCNL